nr:uncharacterized protein LOC129448500 isoform X2 [Misgurnus anguillicaudatus]
MACQRPLTTGVLSTYWNLTRPLSICGVRGSNVTIPCNFATNTPSQVTEVSWCLTSEGKNCDRHGPYVYNSSHTNNRSNFQYTGDKISNCSLLISNINSTSSGEYLFRCITSSPTDRWTSNPGTTVTVTDLKVSMTRLGDNENITVGDSLNLTCTVSCPGHLPELQWLKDHKTIPHTGPILIFRSVTPEDSGNYSCSLKNFKSSESEQIGLYVKGSISTSWSTTYFWVGIIGACLVLIIFIVLAVILIKKKAKTQGTTTSEDEGKTTQRSEDVPQEEEVQYASVSIKTKEMPANTELKNEDSTIYSGVRVREV